MKVLVTGGAGYIGSHTCKLLAELGHEPISIDNLVYGHEWAVKWGKLYKEDISNTEKLIEILNIEKPEAIIHFAAYAYVGESVKDPLKYYKNNVLGSLSILRAMQITKVRKIVFSSTCATYGIPDQLPIHENMPQNPINPYGSSKLFVEQMLKAFGSADGIKSVALRYFNAAGADLENILGEDHNPETHLIPLTIQAAFNPQQPLTVMGTDYPTFDGTCIRDYIHVTDLAQAHLLALQYLDQTKDNFSNFNLGTGEGISVKEVIAMVESVTGRSVYKILGKRRDGDPPSLVAKSEKANTVLGWKPQHSSLENIVTTANHWFDKKNRTV